eukprot:jgi/Undpi1/6818/HiC_scaffold_21.g09294.m1
MCLRILLDNLFLSFIAPDIVSCRKAMSNAVVVGLVGSDQVLVYPRDDSTGELSKFTELSALDGEEFTEGTVAGFVLSSDTLFMNIAVEKSGKGGIALYDANICLGSTCDVAGLLDENTLLAAGGGAFCTWKDDVTVTVTFGDGYTLAENSTVVLDETSDYISGCPDCVQYSSGSAVIQSMYPPPVLSSAQFTNTGAQVTLGVLPDIRPTSGSSCSDGDGSSLTLLDDVVRIEIGAFLTTPSGCVAVGYPADPDPPFVTISAPGAIGHCDDLTVDGSVTVAFLGDANITWNVAIASESSASILNVTNLMEQVVGPSSLERTRGSSITIRSETGVPSCSTAETTQNTASFSWSLVSATDSMGEMIDGSRDPRVLVIPRYALGFAGDSYVFQLMADFGGVSNGANVTVSIISGPIVAAISGGTRRKIGVSQEVLRKYNPSTRIVLYGCAAASVDGSCSSRVNAGFDFEWAQVDSNIDLSIGWGEVFSTSVYEPTLVARAGVFTPGRTYTFSLTATDSDGTAGYFSFEANSPPVGGYVTSNQLTAVAGQDLVTLATAAWIDDFDDLPMSYKFGLAYGRHEVLSVSSEVWLTMLSTGASSSDTLTTRLPPSTEAAGFNITIVSYVSDNLGATAVTSLGADRAPLVIVSTPPNEAVITTSVVQSYLALDSTAEALGAGAESLAGAVTSYAGSGPINSTSLAEISGAVTDMIEVAEVGGGLLATSSAFSLLQTLSVLLNASEASSSSSSDSFTGSTSFGEKEEYITLLSSLGRAVAAGAEAGENLDDISAGSLGLKAAKMSPTSVPDVVLTVPRSQTKISFDEWSVTTNEEDSASNYVFAVTSLGDVAPQGVEGATTINAWGPTGEALVEMADPIILSMGVNGETAEWESGDGMRSCFAWSESDDRWTDDGIGVESVSVGGIDGAANVTCRTYHLSTFASSETQGISLDFVLEGFLTDFEVLQEYAAESWPAILFLSLVTVAFLLPAAVIFIYDQKHGQEKEYLDIIRRTYLARGRCHRQDQPAKTRIQKREREARRDIINNSQPQRRDLQIHTIEAKKKIETIAKAAVDSVFMNHAWGHLGSSSTKHFQATLLTRSQHLVILLADWMSGVTLQAIFYGKSQFDITEKAMMTTATALFMLPTAIIFPTLLREANTPPASVTLRTKQTPRPEQQDHSHDVRGRGMTERNSDDILEEESEDSEEALDAARERGVKVNYEPTEDDGVLSERTSPRPRKENLYPGFTDDTVPDRGEVTVTKTAVYADIISLQKALVPTYIFLPLWLAVLFSLVLGEMSEAEEAVGGNENELLYNFTASLSCACAILCAISAAGMAAHSISILTQVMAFQALCAPGLVLCGGLLFGTQTVLAIGAVVGGLATLVCSYMVRLQRKHELVLADVFEDDLIASWSDPTPEKHAAATVVQGAYRIHLAVVRTTRAKEFNSWLRECQSNRSIVHGMISAVIVLTTVCLLYSNLVFAAKFDRSTCTDWLTTCVLALVIEATLQQPVVLLMTGVLGDFVEEGAAFILELLGS